jgi:hypothetical protein
MISLYTISTVLIVHWIFDFFLQSNWQATNKSKNNFALAQHVGVYSIGLLLIGILNLNLFDHAGWIAGFVAFNAAAHFFVDYVTSRASSSLYAKGDLHDFFVTVGFDQLLHYLTIFTSILFFTK